MTALVPIDAIRIDGGTQIRERISEETVAEYAASIEAGADLPPLIVYHDGSDYWLADGFHRIASHARLGHTDVPCEVRKGTRRDAILYACGANASHGLKRTNADKRRAALSLLNDEEWGKWSDREIARRCGVHGTFVGSVRASLLTDSSEIVTRTYTTRHGTKATMNTANIGAAGAPAERRPSERLSPEERERQIREWAAEGMTASQIGERVGLATTSVREYANKFGVTLVSEMEATGAMREQQVRDMAADGYIAAQIASEIGVSEDWVRHIARRSGITLPDVAMGKCQKRIDTLGVIRETVAALEGLAMALAYVSDGDVERLDASEAQSLAASVAESLRPINKLRKRLTEHKA